MFSSILLVLLFGAQWVTSEWGRLLALGVVLLIAFVASNLLVGAASPEGQSEYCGGSIPESVPIYLLRATRDEAALVLSVAQAALAVGSAIYNKFDKERLSPIGLMIVPVLFYIASLIAYRIHPVSQENYLSITTQVCAMTLYAGALAFLPAIAARLLLSVVTGDWRILNWSSTFVEVDVAPPKSQCTFYSFLWDKKEDNSVLQHGVYENIELRQKIRELIKKVCLS